MIGHTLDTAAWSPPPPKRFPNEPRDETDEVFRPPPGGPSPLGPRFCEGLPSDTTVAWGKSRGYTPGIARQARQAHAV